MMLTLATLGAAVLVTVVLGIALSLLLNGRASRWWPMGRLRDRMPRAVARVIARRERA